MRSARPLTLSLVCDGDLLLVTDNVPPHCAPTPSGGRVAHRDHIMKKMVLQSIFPLFSSPRAVFLLQNGNGFPAIPLS